MMAKNGTELKSELNTDKCLAEVLGYSSLQEIEIDAV